MDRSEWMPPGELRLNLATGRYEYKPQQPRNPAAPRLPVRRGALAGAALAQVREAHASARAQGLRMPACQRIIVSNAGPEKMVLTGTGDALTTPDELGCWSTAAEQLHNLLEAHFE